MIFLFLCIFIVKEECKYGMDGINHSRNFGSILVNDDEMEDGFSKINYSFYTVIGMIASFYFCQRQSKVCR